MQMRRNDDMTRAAWTAADGACVYALVPFGVQHAPSALGAGVKRISTAEEQAP